MQELRQSTQVLAVIGPVVSVSDGITPVTTLSLSSADEAEILKHNTSSVTDISGATFAAITGCDGYYVLTITTSLSDTLGMLTVAINDDSLCLPVTKPFMVLSAFEWDRKYTANSQGLSGVIAYGTAQATLSDTTHIQLASGTSIGADDRANGMTAYIIAGTGANQSRAIIDWDDSDDLATVSPAFGTAPDGTSVYVVLPTPPAVTDSASLPEVAIGADGIVEASFADGALTAAKIATDAIGAAQLADAAADKVAAAVLDAATAAPIDANVAEVNGDAVDGAGTEGDPWGPA